MLLKINLNEIRWKSIMLASKKLILRSVCCSLSIWSRTCRRINFVKTAVNTKETDDNLGNVLETDHNHENYEQFKARSVGSVKPNNQLYEICSGIRTYVLVTADSC